MIISKDSPIPPPKKKRKKKQTDSIPVAATAAPAAVAEEGNVKDRAKALKGPILIPF